MTSLIQFALVYRDSDGVNHADHSITVEAKTINAGIRKAVTEATSTDARSKGWQLVAVHYKTLV